MSDGAYLYVVKCSDDSLYIGTTRTSLEIRIAQHNAGTFFGYTQLRRPVELIFSEWFDRITDAIAAERKLKGWSRAKKLAFIRGDFASVKKPGEAPIACKARWWEFLILRSGHLAASRRMRPAMLGLMVRDGARAPPHHEGQALVPLSGEKENDPHAPGGGGRKWMLCSAASATTVSGFCSFRL
jgi:putative endonuclease